MPYGYKIELDGVDITAKVARFELTASIDSYVRELSLDIADPDLYGTLDFSQLPESPALEVLTRVATEWISQGRFFIERPTFAVGLHSTMTGLWGRSITALLGSPFAVKISKTWTTQTSFYGIAAELLAAAGVAWDTAYSEIADYTIYPHSFKAETAYPIEVLQELAQAAGAMIATDRAGHVCVRKIDYAPASEDVTITDVDAVSISEPPEWPDYGNRIKISASGALSGYRVQMIVKQPCLPADGTSTTRLYARVLDQEGEPVNAQPVAWSASEGLGTLASTVSNTTTVQVLLEEVRAKNFYEIDVALPPKAVLGVYAYRDLWHSDNLIGLGYSIDGNTITLNRKLIYCDQSLRVTYTCDGVAVNNITAGLEAGTEIVTADVSGNTDKGEIYIDNPCQCSTTLRLQVAPGSIDIGLTALLLAYVEENGGPVTVGKMIYLSEVSEPDRGILAWNTTHAGRFEVVDEATSANNDIAGVTQCELSMFPHAVTSVYQRGEDSEGNPVHLGGNLLASSAGKTCTLNAYLPTGTELLATYTGVGGAVCGYVGRVAGQARITAWVDTNREEPLEASVTVTVNDPDPNNIDPPDPPDCCEENCEGAAAAGGEIYYDSLTSGNFIVGETVEVPLTDATGTVGSVGITGTDPWILLTNTGGAPFEVGDAMAGLVSGKEAMITKIAVEGDGGEVVTCKDNETCCEHKTTGQKGCWPTAECKDGTTPNSKKKDDPPWPPPPKGGCTQSDGKIVQCPEGTTCCDSPMGKGCFNEFDCKKAPPSDCFTENCIKTPTAECFAGRFGKAIQLAGTYGCDCFALCDMELGAYGTTQGYDGGSYRSIGQIVSQDFGFQPGTPEYAEKYEEVKTDARDSCREQCGECESLPDLTVFGPETVTSPGGYQYWATGGLTPYAWSVSGTGVTINSDGYVTLDAGACGAFTVTCADRCGGTVTKDVRITNAGRWVQVGSGACSQGSWDGQGYCSDQTGVASNCAPPAMFEQIVGTTKYSCIVVGWCCLDGGAMSFGGCAVPLSSAQSECPNFCSGTTYDHVTSYTIFEWEC